jgi:hypothetical protein
VPQTLEIPPDKLIARLDFYNNSIMLYIIERGTITAQHVAAEDVAASLLSVAQNFSGMLPENTLWYVRKETHTELALYVPPHVQKLALAKEIGKPVERFKIPLPGLVFICSPNQAPSVWAVKERPKSMADMAYNAPFFNTYQDGRTCAGTNKYPDNPAEIPENFFMAFFSLHQSNKPSKSHPDSLYALWKEIDGTKEYPEDDMVEAGPLEKVAR